MRCLPFRGFKNERFEERGYTWYNSLTGKAYSFNDQPSRFKFSPVTEVKYFEWIKNGSYQRDYGKPYKVSYKIDGSVHIIIGKDIPKINEVRNMHRDYHDDWYAYLARYKRFR